MQLTPFPEIRFLESSWKNTVRIAKHSKYSGTVKSSYETADQADTVISGREYTALYQVNAVSSSKYGEYNTRFLFDQKDGFVYMEYIYPDSSKVIIWADSIYVQQP